MRNQSRQSFSGTLLHAAFPVQFKLHLADLRRLPSDESTQLKVRWRTYHPELELGLRFLGFNFMAISCGNLARQNSFNLGANLQVTVLSYRFGSFCLGFKIALL